eukprot:CAMPEP_0181249990 /NCGR_PEP_ID=MMETSP1096-20121128/46067_1 /TAXON_ID=156174 ORGANISM="Chrysochromulina ericina, Strain CCMP281" /NCGR_SAMPLE_ID=MMETSP1096 /ASSEMBLY_ACC=CAM_ASM_000453 /LENGTH=96 /DNA_ID=CAMNT_0023347401 /DNA_START=163 /DNA_END=452 /DNA_ORIENTATION=-
MQMFLSFGAEPQEGQLVTLPTLCVYVAYSCFKEFEINVNHGANLKQAAMVAPYSSLTPLVTAASQALAPSSRPTAEPRLAQNSHAPKGGDRPPEKP